MMCKYLFNAVITDLNKYVAKNFNCIYQHHPLKLDHKERVFAALKVQGFC